MYICREMRKLFFAILICTVFASCSKFEQVRKSDDLNTKVEAAYKYYEDEDYYKAGILFDETLPLLVGKEGAEKAAFTRAMAYYKQRHYLLGAFYLKEFTDSYSRSPLAEEALFMAAKALYEASPSHNLDQESTYDALRALQRFANKYPRSKFIEDANKIADELNRKLELKAFENAKLFYSLGKNNSMYYQSAVQAFSNFQRQFPTSAFNEEASYLRVDAQYRLALASVAAKQRERYLEAIEFYQNFVDAYPQSSFNDEAELVYKKIQEQLEKI